MTDRVPPGRMAPRILTCLSAFLLLVAALGCHAATARVSTPQQIAPDKGFAIRAFIEGGQTGRVGADGTIAVWGSVPSGTTEMQCVMALGPGLAEWTALAVPDDVVLHSAGEVLDLDSDGKQDLLIAGKDPSASSGHAVFFWSGCAPGRLPITLGLSCQMSVTAPAGDRVYASTPVGQVVVLSWKDGSLRETYVADLQKLAAEPFRGFRCHSLVRADIDADGHPEVILGGEAAGQATAFLCHEDGSGGRFTSLAQAGSVTGLASDESGNRLILAVRSATSPNPSRDSGPDGTEPYETRLLVGRTTAGHVLTTIGEVVSCPIAGERSAASLAALGGGELAVAWHTESPSEDPRSFQRHRSTIVTYEFGPKDLKETARSDLEGAWVLVNSAPSSSDGWAGRFLAVLAPGETPEDLAPGVYVFDRRGPGTETTSLAVWWGAGCRVPDAVPSLLGASTPGLEPLVCVRDAGNASIGDDGTVVLWGVSDAASSEPVWRVGVMGSGYGWPTPLFVPDGARLTSGEVLDLNRDGETDFLAVGELSSQAGYVAFLWLGCRPGESPVTLALGSPPDMVVSTTDRVYASDVYGRVLEISWKNGEATAVPVVDIGALVPDRHSGFVFRSMSLGDIDGDQDSELVLGGIVGTMASLFVCHADGGQPCFSSLGEVGWVYDLANRGESIALALRTSLIPVGAGGPGNQHESICATRVVMAKVGSEHQVSLTTGQAVTCPLEGAISDASVAFTGDDELVTLWRAGELSDPADYLDSRPIWSRSSLVTYSAGREGLRETARLECASRLVDVGPSAVTGQGGVLAAYLDGDTLPQGWPPGLYLLAHGQRTGFHTFSLAGGVSFRVSAPAGT